MKRKKIWHRVNFWGNYYTFTSTRKTKTEFVGCRTCPEFNHIECQRVIKRTDAYADKQEAYRGAVKMFEQLALDTVARAEVWAAEFRDKADRFREEASGK
jgi:Fe2+ or Zn2+ uptake regulation protein